MATIERKPLPPLNSNAVKIAEADRAEIMAQADDVIDYYVNGPGSYFESGTQKPLASELGQSRVANLENFRDMVIASKQFADDPASIIDAVVNRIRDAIEGAKVGGRYEGQDPISRAPPVTSDPIDDPRVISPRALYDPSSLISWRKPNGRSAGAGDTAFSPFATIPLGHYESELGSEEVNGSAFPANDKNFRYLARSTAVGDSSLAPRTIELGRGASQIPNGSLSIRWPTRPIGLVSRELMPDDLFRLPLQELSENSKRHDASGTDWLLRMLQSGGAG